MSAPSYTQDVCPSCLVYGRELRVINNSLKREYFCSILHEISALDVPECPLVCWECEARISSAVKFRKRVQHAFTQLNNITAECSMPQQTSQLTITAVYKGTYSPCDNSDGFIPEEAWLSIDTEYTRDNSHTLKTENTHNSSDVDEHGHESINQLENLNKQGQNDVIDRLDEPIEKPLKKRKKYKNIFKVVGVTESENEKERNDIEVSEWFRTSIYKCDTCLIAFKDEERLNVHFKDKHLNNGGLCCATCRCLMSTKSELASHVQKHLRRYQCLLCEERSTNKRAALKHHQNFHAKKPAAQISSGEHPCPACDKVFRWKASLRKHLESHRILSGERETPRCEVCKLSFKSQDCLQKHISTSIKHQLHSEIKGGGGVSRQRVEAARAASARFVCVHCDARFLYKGNMQRHVASHEARASGELHCAECDRSFSSLATYRNHMRLSRRHARAGDVWRHECADCGKRFIDKRKLKDHVDFEHLKKYTYTCQPCNKVFKSGTSLYLHDQSVHSEAQDQHLCHHCARPYKSAQKLRAHLLAQHSAEQPYKCNLCSASFAWQSCVSRHIKVVHEKIKCKRKAKKKEDAESNG